MKEPFYAHFLGGINRVITDKIKTAAVGLNSDAITLFINEDFFLKELRSESERVAVIKHETLHLLFKHLFRLKDSNYDRKLFNIAADLVVNQYIENWTLPEGAITLDAFSELNLKENQTVEWYYKALNEHSKNNSSLNEKIQTLQNSGSHSDHSLWNKKSSKISEEFIESELDNHIIQTKNRTSVKDYDKIPSLVKESISKIISTKKGTIDWKRSLRLFSTSSKRTRIYHSMKRISKRYGTRPGIKIKRYQKIAVAIDTSGSVSKENISSFFNEIYKIWKTGAEIDVIECDAEIQKVYPYKGKTPEFINGRGGTVFDPVFEFLKKNRSTPYDGCIYFTDGYADEPKVKPPCRIFWLITKGGKIGDHLKYGRSIQMN